LQIDPGDPLGFTDPPDQQQTVEKGVGTQRNVRRKLAEAFDESGFTPIPDPPSTNQIYQSRETLDPGRRRRPYGSDRPGTPSRHAARVYKRRSRYRTAQRAAAAGTVRFPGR
jgi:hypothetical protein